MRGMGKTVNELHAPVAQPGQQIPPEDLAAHAAWVNGQKEVAVLMLLPRTNNIQPNLRLRQSIGQNLTDESI
ncbi:hypothetical protein Tco_0997185 [Tanacetum coccineum]